MFEMQHKFDFTGHDRIANMLIENGADVNIDNAHNNPPLILAISYGICKN